MPTKLNPRIVQAVQKAATKQAAVKPAVTTKAPIPPKPMMQQRAPVAAPPLGTPTVGRPAPAKLPPAVQQRAQQAVMQARPIQQQLPTAMTAPQPLPQPAVPAPTPIQQPVAPPQTAMPQPQPVPPPLAFGAPTAPQQPSFSAPAPGMSQQPQQPPMMPPATELTPGGGYGNMPGYQLQPPTFGMTPPGMTPPGMTPPDLLLGEQAGGIPIDPNYNKFKDFYNSQEYRDYQRNTLTNPNDPFSGQLGTADMYSSPYFGERGSGSLGGAQDAAYEAYLRRTGQTNLIQQPTF